MWSPTGLIPWFSKTEGNTYATLLHHPLLFGEIQRSAQEVARRISGAVAGEAHARASQPYQVPITIPISRITLFAICLSFSSPPLHPCCFIGPLFPNLLLSISLVFFRLSCVSSFTLSLWLVLLSLFSLPNKKFTILNKGRGKV